MGMGFAPTWLRQVSVSPPPQLHNATLTTGRISLLINSAKRNMRTAIVKHSTVSYIISTRHARMHTEHTHARAYTFPIYKPYHP